MACYEIYKQTDGSFLCCGMVQDGTERWKESTLEGAIKSLKKFAKVCNHGKIKRKDIVLYESQQVVRTEWNPTKLPKKG